MPFAYIHMIEGRAAQRKKVGIEKVTQALVQAVGAPKENVRVWVTKVSKEDWSIAGVSANALGP